MLTSRRRAGAPSALWSAAAFGALTVSVVTATSAAAGGVDVWSCVGGWRGPNCVELWGPAVNPYVRAAPKPLGEAEKQRAEERDRKWLARCHPVVEHDRYGVARYHYAAPGCEFGVSED